MNNTKNMIIIIFLILLSLTFIFMGIFNDDRECLKQKAEKYCDKKGLSYSGGINVWPPMFFWCYPEEDKHIMKRFTFTEEERNYCRRMG